MQRRDTQISFLIRFAQRWKEESAPDRALMRSDPWKFDAWSESVVEDPQWEHQRQILLHLFHPDDFEPIVNPDHKRLIVARFASLAGNETNVDKEILAIRAALTPVEGGERFSWYDEPRINRWWKNKPKWPALCKWAEAFRLLPDFEEAERTYKLKAIEPVQATRSAVLRGGDDWHQTLKRGFQNADNNITNWQAHDTFLKWAAANQNVAKTALAMLWGDTTNTEVERVRAFLDLIPPEAISTPGNRLTIASYLLMAEDPTALPPYKPSAIKAAWELAGWKVPPIEPEYVVYDTFLVLLDELVHACPSLHDRLDAQGALWAITKWKHDEKPASWSDAEWADFLAFRAGNVAEPEPPPPGGGALGDPNKLIAEAAAELHLDRSVLDNIVQLLEDKRQVILYGPPGTGKTYLAKKLANALAGGDASRSTVVQFHPAMSYEDFVQGLRPEETPSGAVMYRLRDGHLMRMVKRADANPDQRHVMVIDEINRANLPKVLGELLFLLEYRDDAIPLLYEPDAAFRLPKNLWFIGTMNTADRSIALIDAALRRRFHFVPFFPTQPPIEGVLEQFLEDNGFSTAPAAFLRAVNADLLTKQNVDEHVLIGPSHFMNPNHYVDGALPEPIVERIWTYNVFPLIEELLWGQNAEIEQWRWPKTRTRYTTQLGITLPPTEPADAADAEAVAPEG